MVTSGMLYLDLVLILPTIRSKHSSRALCRVGAQSTKSVFGELLSLSHSFIRCSANPEDLDGESTWRTRQHSDAIVEELELGVLWHEYGLVGDIVVCIFFIPFLFLFPFRSATIWSVIYWHVITWRSEIPS